MDNSPTWDMVLKTIDPATVRIPEYRRKDLSHGVNPDMRPSDDDYDRFVYLVDLFRRCRYDEKEIRKESPFLIYDPLFNSILCAADESLVRISEILNKPYREPEEWYNITAAAIRERLYHGEHGLFDCFDLVGKRLLEVDTAAGFMPLFCGAPTVKQVSRLYDYLNSKSFCALHQGNCFTIPNYDTQKEGFERTNYWRGPVWININWMLMNGLKRYGFIQKADSVAKDILELPVRFGFYEYYDSFDGRGYGSKDFSWTSALFIDTAYENYEKTGRQSIAKRIKKLIWSDIILNESGTVTGPLPERLSEEMMMAIKEIKSRYYTEKGTVDYDAIRRSGEYREYKMLAAMLKDFDLTSLRDERERLAFWINLYNTIVVDGIVTLNIKSSVREVIGFFSRIKYNIGGYRFSPDDIEHGILRANSRPVARPFRQFGVFDRRRGFSLKSVDPRIHFALVCGSRSCAPIKFYTPEGIHDELEIASLNFINSSEVIVLPEENRIVISIIFRWFGRDFGGRRGVLGFIEKYLVDDDKKEFLKERRETLKIDYLYYDWNLNR
jgi:hypothetical protein